MIENNQQKFLNTLSIKSSLSQNQTPEGKPSDFNRAGDYLQNPDKQAEVKKIETQIDQLVYNLYALTPEEIEIVEGTVKR